MGSRNRHLCGSVKTGAFHDRMRVSWTDETHHTPKPMWMCLEISIGDPIYGPRAAARIAMSRVQLEELIDGLTKAREAMDDPRRVVTESEVSDAD